jgi:haloacetate dehalogenase
MEELYGDVVDIWREWATDVRGVAIDSGHHVAEEAPAELADVLLDFLAVSVASEAPPVRSVD